LAAYPINKFLIISPLGGGIIHDEDGAPPGREVAILYDDASIEAAGTPFLITNYERVRDGNITRRSIRLLASVSMKVR